MQLSVNEVALVSAFSGLLGGLLVAIVGGIFNLRSKRNEYINDYYKSVLQRRITAYEHLESLIVAFKTAIADVNCRTYHLSFNSTDGVREIFMRLGSTMNQGLWLSDKCFDEVRKLNFVIYQLPENENEYITFGQRHYEELARLRETLEIILASDMLEMHKIEIFLKQKKGRGIRATEPFNIPSSN